MRSVPRGWRDAAAAILFAALAAEVGRAATFEPEVHADLGHSDDVYYDAVEPRPDWFAVFALVLPLRGEGQRNRWELSYRPSAFRYRDLSELDHYEHRVRVGAESIARRETSFAIEAGWARSQEQGNATSVLAGDLFLVPRSELEALSFGASLRREQGARFVWNVEARGADADYSPIPDAETEPPSAILEDRREYELVAGFGRLVSRAAEVGLEYRYRRYDLDVTGEENDHLVSVTASRRLSERTAVEGRVGAFRRDLASPPAVEAPGDATDTGIQASVGIERTSRQGRFSLEGSHGPSSGGALEGTSTDTVAGIRWEGARAERLRWDAGARWARRDPTIEGEPTLRSAGMGAGIEWLPRRQVGLRARADWVRQSGDETAVRNGSFLTASIGASWYPGGATSRPGTGRR